MPETWNLVHEYKHICSFRKYSFWYQESLTLSMPVFYLQNVYVFWKNSAFIQKISMRAVLEIL